MEPQKKIIKKIIKRPLQPVTNETAKSVQTVKLVKLVKPVEVKPVEIESESESEAELVEVVEPVNVLENMINEGKSVGEIAKILNKSEQQVRFQMKMHMYNQQNKDINVTKLLDEDSIKHNIELNKEHNKTYKDHGKLSYQFDEEKLNRQMIKFMFLEKVKGSDTELNQIYEKLKKDCILQIKLN
jgi:hypothetical protein